MLKHLIHYKSLQQVFFFLFDKKSRNPEWEKHLQEMKDAIQALRKGNKICEKKKKILVNICRVQWYCSIIRPSGRSAHKRFRSCEDNKIFSYVRIINKQWKGRNYYGSSLYEQLVNTNLFFSIVILSHFSDFLIIITPLIKAEHR